MAMSALGLRAVSIQSEVANMCAHMFPSLLNTVIDSCGWISTQEQIYIYMYMYIYVYIYKYVLLLIYVYHKKEVLHLSHSLWHAAAAGS